MRCLCCGKQLKATSLEEEKKTGWHRRCVKNFFDTSQMPSIDISETQLLELAKSTVAQGLTVPGVQKKLSLHLSQQGETRLTIVDYPTGYILKPQTEEYRYLPEFEDLAMRMAKIVGIQTVPHALVKINDQYAYITKRIDREITDKEVKMFAMEDFCQLSNRLTQDKYKGSYESCARIIKRYSVYSGLDLTELFLRVVFSFVIGNSDMHLKNFSLKEMESGSREFCLSQAYDLLPVNIILPEDQEQMALTLNGKKRNLHKKDFIVFVDSCGIEKRTAIKLMNKICMSKGKFLDECEKSYLPDDLKEEMKNLIEKRIAIIA